MDDFNGDGVALDRNYVGAEARAAQREEAVTRPDIDHPVSWKQLESEVGLQMTEVILAHVPAAVPKLRKGEVRYPAVSLEFAEISVDTERIRLNLLETGFVRGGVETELDRIGILDRPSS